MRQAPLAASGVSCKGAEGLPHPGVSFSSFGLVVFVHAFGVLLLGEFSTQHEDKSIPKMLGFNFNVIQTKLVRNCHRGPRVGTQRFTPGVGTLSTERQTVDTWQSCGPSAAAGLPSGTAS